MWPRFTLWLLLNLGFNENLRSIFHMKYYQTKFPNIYHLKMSLGLVLFQLPEIILISDFANHAPTPTKLKNSIFDKISSMSLFQALIIKLNRSEARSEHSDTIRKLENLVNTEPFSILWYFGSLDLLMEVLRMTAIT